jgi:hypothetical protein
MYVSSCSTLRLVLPGLSRWICLGEGVWSTLQIREKYDTHTHTHTQSKHREGKYVMYQECEGDSSGFHKRMGNSLTSWVTINFSRNIPNLVVSGFF